MELKKYVAGAFSLVLLSNVAVNAFDIKKNVEENKPVYIAAGVGVVSAGTAGAAAWFIQGYRSGKAIAKTKEEAKANLIVGKDTVAAEQAKLVIEAKKMEKALNEKAELKKQSEKLAEDIKAAQEEVKKAADDKKAEKETVVKNLEKELADVKFLEGLANSDAVIAEMKVKVEAAKKDFVDEKVKELEKAVEAFDKAVPAK